MSYRAVAGGRAHGNRFDVSHTQIGTVAASAQAAQPSQPPIPSHTYVPGHAIPTARARTSTSTSTSASTSTSTRLTSTRLTSTSTSTQLGPRECTMGGHWTSSQ
ncbi:hypothetical protein SMMN14_04109 [Sphaerulina musiva]